MCCNYTAMKGEWHRQQRIDCCRELVEFNKAKCLGKEFEASRGRDACESNFSKTSLNMGSTSFGKIHMIKRSLHLLQTQYHMANIYLPLSGRRSTASSRLIPILPCNPTLPYSEQCPKPCSPVQPLYNWFI